MANGGDGSRLADCAFIAFSERIAYSFEPRDCVACSASGKAGNGAIRPGDAVRDDASDEQARSIAGWLTRRLNSSSRRAEASSRSGGMNRDSARSRMLPSGTWGEVSRPSGPNWKCRRTRGEA